MRSHTHITQALLLCIRSEDKCDDIQYVSCYYHQRKDRYCKEGGSELKIVFLSNSVSIKRDKRGDLVSVIRDS